MKASGSDGGIDAVRIRRYRPTDAGAVGVLIAETYEAFNLADFPTARRIEMLGPFAHASLRQSERRDAIASAIEAPLVLVAEENGSVIGVLRSSPGRVHSLFVSGEFHRRGVGSALLEAFEARVGPGRDTTVAATLSAVPFYESAGYRKTTGVRTMNSFEGRGLPYQPMKKTSARPDL